MKLFDLINSFPQIFVVNRHPDFLTREINSIVTLDEEIGGTGILLVVKENALAKIVELQRDLQLDNVVAIALYNESDLGVNSMHLMDLLDKDIPILMVPGEIPVKRLESRIRGQLPQMIALENAWWQDELLAY